MSDICKNFNLRGVTQKQVHVLKSNSDQNQLDFMLPVSNKYQIQLRKFIKILLFIY